jgi:hypothetical protein
MPLAMLIDLTGLRDCDAEESWDMLLARCDGKICPLGPGDFDTNISFASWKVALCSSSSKSLSDKLSATLLRRVSTSSCRGSTNPRRR